MHKVFVLASLAFLAGCQTTTGQGNGKPEGSEMPFSQMQAVMAASVFSDVCIATLPSFDGAEGVLQKLGAKHEANVWSLGGGAAVFSVQDQGSRKGCVATVQAAKNHELLTAISREINDPQLPLRGRKAGSNLAFLTQTTHGPAFIVFTPNTSTSAASTFFVETADRN